MISPNTQQNLQGVNQQGMPQKTFFVNINGGGRDSAISYPIAAGYEVFLLDEESKMFFIKRNNGMGITLREFEYEEVTPTQTFAEANPGSFDTSKYVTKEDFNTLVEEVRRLQGSNKGHHYSNTRNVRRSRNGKPYDNE